ncbi:hypothetical protein AU14_17440 [Marinobacter similis]|uniref:Uncharacterized protein n=1 Tax=Marinobacter similis TaxID=1420916 RepID=W5YUT8_9GAMM|nr:hypothetical protein AU14_17440 [Marinobacter similis]
MKYNAITRFHMLLDQNLAVPEEMFLLIGREQGQEAEFVARLWCLQIEKSRPQE